MLKKFLPVFFIIILGFLSCEKDSLEENLVQTSNSVIEKEIIPIIEKQVRVKKDSRTLLGHSLGGLLGSYLLLNHSKIFDNYIISSPSM